MWKEHQHGAIIFVSHVFQKASGFEGLPFFIRRGTLELFSVKGMLCEHGQQERHCLARWSIHFHTHTHTLAITHTKKKFVLIWLEFLDLMQQLLPELSTEQSYTVGISTLHGNIIHVDVETRTLVKIFKQQCIDESQLDVAPLKINVDFAGLMNGSDKFTKWEGVRLANVNDGALLDDDRSIGSQVVLSQDVFMFKLVFMKQSWEHFSADERTMLAHFADGKRGVSGYMLPLPPHDTPFVVMPVWGGVDSRPNEILGMVYQHQATQEHCSLVGRGIDPRGVDMSMPRRECIFQK